MEIIDDVSTVRSDQIRFSARSSASAVLDTGREGLSCPRAALDYRAAYNSIGPHPLTIRVGQCSAQSDGEI